MKVQLLSVGTIGYEIYENLGIERIKSFLKNNDVDVLSSYINLEIGYSADDFSIEMKKIDFSCDIFGFSIYHSNKNETVKMIGIIKEKKPDAVICLGSKYASLCYESLLDEALLTDFIVLGDGETPFLKAINHLKEGGALCDIAENNEHIATRKNRINRKICNIDINILPWPDRSNLKKSSSLFAYVCDMHGCDGKCSFCGLRRSNERNSYRNAGDLMQELIYIYRYTGIRIFYFTSGSFEIPGKRGKERIRSLCKLLLDYPVKFSLRCFMKAETFNESDKELLLLMKKSGFNYILVGIEAGNEFDLKVYNKRATLADNHKILSLLNEAAIYASDFGFMMFNPYSTLQTIADSFHFLVAQKCCCIWRYINRLGLTYNTAIYERIKNDSLIIKGEIYKFANDDVHSIFKFVENRFYDSRIIKNERFYTELCDLYYMTAGMLDLGGISMELSDISGRLFTLMKDFFDCLYVQKDMKSCVENFDMFGEKINREYDKSRILVNKIRKKYIKYEKANALQNNMAELSV